MIDDPTLLDRYANERSEEAFAELVRRHLPLVYSAALRRTNGDAHRAEDVAQAVFTTMARDAEALSRHAALTGWLYTATRHAAIDLMRAERRRLTREQEAHAMQEQDTPTEPAADWEQLRPVLDEAMDELDERDREAVLLRFFQGQGFAAVGAALRLSEDTARKRVDRALDKLHGLLARRGIASTTGALALALANQTAVAVPMGVAASVTATVMAGVGATTAGTGTAGVTGIFKIMSTTKIIAGVSGVIALLAVGTALYEAQSAREAASALGAANHESDALRAQLSAGEKRAQQAAAAAAVAQKELAELRTSVAAAKAAASTPAPAAKAPSEGSMMDYVLDHPETQAAYVEQQVLRARVRFERFVKTAGLSPEQREAFFAAIKDRGAAELDFILALHRQGYGVGSLPQDPQVRAELQKLATEQREKFDHGLRSVLGDDGYTAYQQFGATLPERNAVDELGGQLYLSENPLTAPQAEQLTQLLRQNRYSGQPTATPATTMNGTLLTRQMLMSAMGQVAQQSGQSLLEWRAPITDAAVAKAEAVLSPGQLAALKQLQAQQLAQFQIAPPPAAGTPAAAKLSGGK